MHGCGRYQWASFSDGRKFVLESSLNIFLMPLIPHFLRGLFCCFSSQILAKNYHHWIYPPAMVWSRWSLAAPLLVDAWFDTGHMLVAHIAKAQLPKEHVETVERLLNMWSNDFPGMSTFVSSSVWPDHIKCTTSEAPICSGLPATALDAYLV